MAAPGPGGEKPYAENAGVIRPSQLVSTFGPGSLVQTEHDSIMVMGPDSWSPRREHYRTLRHAYLEALLGKTHFRMPKADRGMVVSCRSFPAWGVCSNPRCRILQRHRAAPPAGRTEFSCDRCRSPLYPARFVMMCERGHIDDFPWVEWAHSKPKSECSKPHPVLRMRARGKSTALSDYYVSCDDCGASRSCGQATSRGGLAGIVDKCSGASPWLGGGGGEGGGRPAARCGEGGGEGGGPARPHGVQTLSTSLYYPSTVSALYIPRLLHPVQRIIDDNMDAVNGARAVVTLRDLAERHPLFAKVRERYGAEEVEAQLAARLAPAAAGGTPITKSSTEDDIRRIEYDDLMAPGEFHDREYLEIGDADLGSGAPRHISALKRVRRLTEVRVIRSFTRGTAPDPHSPESNAEVHFCPIAGRPMDWYPAVENKGEGLLFSIDEGLLCEWEGRRAVAERCAPTIEALEQWARERRWPRRDPPSPRYLLVHTVSHILNRELARRSGYSEASIRERIYCGAGYNAILLYTASQSSDGSLGGLVRQGEPGRFLDLLSSAVRRSASCSGDPLCAGDDPAAKRDEGVPAHARLNGSACYGCALLPETSCECANRLLDRRLVAGDDELGFFNGLA